MPYKQAAEQRQELPSRSIPRRRRPQFVPSRSILAVADPSSSPPGVCTPSTPTPDKSPAASTPPGCTSSTGTGRKALSSTGARPASRQPAMEGRPMHEPVTDLELASDATPSTVEAAAGAGSPVAVYLARLTSPESRRAMAASLELLAELLVDGHPAEATERARRRGSAIPWQWPCPGTSCATAIPRPSASGWPSTARRRPPTATWPPFGACSGRPGGSGS
jgi:hypothetical protein